MREAGAAGPKGWEGGRLAPAQAAPRRTLSGQGRGRVPTPEHRGGHWRVCGQRLGRDRPLEGAAGQRLHQAPLGCPRPVCPGSLQAGSARPSAQTEAGTPALTLPSCPTDNSIHALLQPSVQAPVSSASKPQRHSTLHQPSYPLLICQIAPKFLMRPTLTWDHMWRGILGNSEISVQLG